MQFQPNSVILLDEIEKVGPAIHNLLLGVMDEGALFPTAAIHADFSHTIIIMTSNVGASQIFASKIGFASSTEVALSASQQTVMKAMRDRFAPEFINRLTRVVVFNPLTDNDFRKITALILEKKKKQLAEKKIQLSWMPEVLGFIVKRYADVANGARPLARGVDQLIMSKIAMLIVQKDLQAGQEVRISVANQKIRLKVA